MSEFRRSGYLFVLGLACLLLFGSTAQAKGEDTIKKGIFAGDIDLAGMTVEEAKNAVEAYVENLAQTEITLLAAEGNEVIVTAGDMGIAWANPELVDEAVKIGTQGNVIERYRIKKDLEHENKIYPIELSYDMETIGNVLSEKCSPYDVEAVNASMKRVKGEFEVKESITGYRLDVESSIYLINDYLMQEWDRQPFTIALNVEVIEPKGKAEDLACVTDILGSFTTHYYTSNAGRRKNVENGCRILDGTVLYPGEEIATRMAMDPVTEANGFDIGGAYVNGKLVDSLGGGICQVSTTLYNAVLRAELEITQRDSHSMTVSYVELAADAAMAKSSGKDLKFMNNLEYPIYIEGYTDGEYITFNIYGKETRDPGRKVRFESEVLEVTSPSEDSIVADGSKPVGYITTSGAHIGYKARLWKIVTQDGKEIERSIVNTSRYKMVPRSAVVGTATEDPAVYEQIMDAIDTANINHVKNVVAALTQ